MSHRNWFRLTSALAMPWLMGGVNAYWDQWPAWVMFGYWASLFAGNVGLLLWEFGP